MKKINFWIIFSTSLFSLGVLDNFLYLPFSFTCTFSSSSSTPSNKFKSKLQTK